MSSFYIGKWEDKGEPFSIPGFWEVEHSEMAPTWWPHNSAKPSWLYRDEVSCICRRGKMWEKCYSFNNNSKDFPGGPMVKILPSNAGGVDSIPGLGAKILNALPPPSPSGREGNGTPVLLPGESQGREAWWAAVYGVAQSRTQLKRLSSSSGSSHPMDLSGFLFLTTKPPPIITNTLWILLRCPIL